MVNIVIIGVGDITRKRHIPGILQAKSACLYGFCNRNPQKALEAVEKYGGHFYGTAEEVFLDSAVDAVLIATPPDTHAKLSVAALRAGKHVLLEKPIALSLQDAMEIEREAARSSAKLMLLHVQRFYDPHKKAKELLEKGEIGRLLSCRTFLGNGRIEKSDEISRPFWKDALFNVGIHRIDLLNFLIGSEVTGVFGYCSHLLFPEEAEKEAAPNDHAVGILQYANNIVATMVASQTSFNGEDRSTVLVGTEGTITTYARTHELIVEKKNGESYFFDFDSAHEQNKLELTNAHEEFCRCILEDKEPPVTATDGVASMRIALALKKANVERRWISL